jgi:DNA-directed RNA polymerase subunit F
MTTDQYVTLAEVKEMLDTESLDREFTPEQKLALEHAKGAKLSAEQARELKAKLLDLEFISDLNNAEMVAVKLTDLLPTHFDDVRLIFQKERRIIDKKQAEQIIKLVNDYL